MNSVAKLLLILVGVAALISLLVAGTCMYLGSEAGDAAEEMRYGPGTDELRAMGCSDATVIDLGAVADTVKADEAEKEAAKVAVKVNVTCVVESEKDAPTCQKVGETYVASVPDAPPTFNVSVVASEGTSLCTGFYDKASGGVKSAAEMMHAGGAQGPEAKQEPPQPPPPSQVTIQLVRKGMLFIGEEKVGRTKKHQVALQPGEHTIVVKWNKKLKVEHTLVVEPFKSYTVMVLKKKVKVTEKDVESPPAADSAADGAAKASGKGGADAPAAAGGAAGGDAVDEAAPAEEPGE